MSSGDDSPTNIFGDASSPGIDVDVVKGLTLIGIVVLVLFTLMLLRFGCTICIDLIILRDSDSLIRSISEVRRIFLPWIHPRTQPSSPRTPTTTSPGDDYDEENGGATTELTTIDMDFVLSGLTNQQKQSLVEEVLTTIVRFSPKCLSCAIVATEKLHFQTSVNGTCFCSSMNHNRLSHALKWKAY